MEWFLLFIFYFIFCFIFYQIYYWIRRKKEERLLKMPELTYLVNIYKLDIKKIGLRKLLNIFSLFNALILSLSLFIFRLFGISLITLLMAFILISILIVITYHFIGRFYQKKGMIKDV